uniref:Uncharacterized protein n=1 Tax=Calcidiscus leptoporus TaxID=127549 RepID=A0A7S0JHI1_9EUKA|mmetsp:Transcript_58959/g.135201  ORF Transcript_58959/g.135201 Transcript_58959/m.135201 type:complete len:116 (+) Transcript_58959:129-476(+)
MGRHELMMHPKPQQTARLTVTTLDILLQLKIRTEISYVVFEHRGGFASGVDTRPSPAMGDEQVLDTPMSDFLVDVDMLGLETCSILARGCPKYTREPTRIKSTCCGHRLSTQETS